MRSTRVMVIIFGVPLVVLSMLAFRGSSMASSSTRVKDAASRGLGPSLRAVSVEDAARVKRATGVAIGAEERTRATALADADTNSDDAIL